jgi:amino acid transporter
MTPKRFKTKIDHWLPFLLAAAMAFEAVVMNIAGTWANQQREASFLIVTALAIVALVGFILIGICYAVFGREPGSVRR